MAYYIHLGNSKFPCDLSYNFHVDSQKPQFKKFKKDHNVVLFVIFVSTRLCRMSILIFFCVTFIDFMVMSLTLESSSPHPTFSLTVWPLFPAHTPRPVFTSDMAKNSHSPGPGLYPQLTV